MPGRDPREDYPIEHFWRRLSAVVAKSEAKQRSNKKIAVK